MDVETWPAVKEGQARVGDVSLEQLLRQRFAEIAKERSEIAKEMNRLEERASELAREDGHVRALLECHGSSQADEKPVAVGLAGGEDGPDWDLAHPETMATEQSSPPWLKAVVEVLCSGEPMHYRDLYKKLRALGGAYFGGQNPLATFLAAVSREASRPDGQLERAGRGMYRLRGQEAA